MSQILYHQGVQQVTTTQLSQANLIKKNMMMITILYVCLSIWLFEEELILVIVSAFPWPKTSANMTSLKLKIHTPQKVK